MDFKNNWRYQTAIIAFLILFIILIPIPKIASLTFLWIAMILSVKILSGCWYFGFFIGTTFIAILFIFLLIRSKNDNLEFRKAFIENFADKVETKTDNLPMLVDQIQKTDKPSDTASIETPKEVSIPIVTTPVQEKKISMMDTKLDDDEIVFGKLDTGEFEDSDEDTNDNEAELEKNAGKTTVSSKKAYRAQKQLYDLTTAVSKLHDNMVKLEPSLKKGAKILESMEQIGILKNMDKFV